MTQHNYEYISRYYGVPARLNAPVTYKGRPWKVTGTDGQYILITFDGEAKQSSGKYHATWQIEWLETKEQIMALTPKRAFELLRVVVVGLIGIQKGYNDSELTLLLATGDKQKERFTGLFKNIAWPKGVTEWPFRLSSETNLEPIQPTCSDCKFWKKLGPDDESEHVVGECHRYPPVARAKVKGEFPETYHSEMCGEFQQNPNLA